MIIGSLFSGYGGLEMGVQAALGGTVAWHCEIDPGASKILAHHWPDVPNLGDITKIDWAQVEPVDVLTGGFPCQDVSHAGKRAGLRPDTRSGLWSQFAYAIEALRPSLVVIENVRGLLSAKAAGDDLGSCPWCVDDSGGPALRALGAVLGDLADLGFDAEWTSVRASDVGAPHGRFRVFVVAWPAGNPDVTGLEGRRGGPGRSRERAARSTGLGPPADAPDLGHERGGSTRGRWAGSADGRGTPADARREHGQRGPNEVSGGAGSRRSPGEPGRSGEVDWGVYTAAVRRWERLTRPAPAPTQRGAKGGQQLSPRFVEWLMGLPAGHVTDVPGLSRNDQLKALGNGVVPQQAAAALAMLLDAKPKPEQADEPPALLPTPNPFHAGNTEQPDEWRARRLDVFKRTGTRHGPALSVVALSVAQGKPLDPRHYMPDEDTS